MKFVSPFQRGTTCRCRWPSTPAPATRPRLIPALNPCGDIAAVSACTLRVEQRPHLGALGCVQVAGRGQMPVGRDHHVPVRVRVQVHEHVGALAAVHDEAGGIVAGRAVAEHAPARVGPALDVLQPPGRPQLLGHIQRFQWK